MTTDPWNHWKALATLAGSGHSRFATFFDSAESFAAAARAYLGAGQTPAAAAEATRTFNQFLREQSVVFFQPPWSAESPGAAPPWQTMFEAPALGLTREHQQRWQRTAEAARRVAVAQNRLQCLWSDALRDAAAAFMAGVAAPRAAAAGAAPPGAASLRGLYDAWIDCAEEAYAVAAHSDSFCDALAEFVNAGSQWRREFGASVEQWSKLLDLPTRSELNSLTRRLQAAEERLREPDERRPARPGDKPRSAPRRASRAATQPAAKPASTFQAVSRGTPRDRARRAKRVPKA